jgi:hypothetical protein
MGAVRKIAAHSAAVVPEGSSLGQGLADEQSRVETQRSRLSPHNIFEWAMFLVVVANCFTLAVDGVWEWFWDEHSSAAEFVEVADFVFTTLFTIEFGIKAIAYGLLWVPGTYFRSGWNILDALIVSIGWLSISFPGFQALQALKGLRVFRLASRSPKLRLVVEVLNDALPSLFSVFLLFCLFMFTFACLGIALFKGSFFGCSVDLSDPSYTSKRWFNKEDCLAAGGTWAHVSEQHFDNFPVAVFSVFRIAMLSGWADLMLHACRAPSNPDDGPRKDALNPLAPLYFMGVIMSCSFLVINLFVAVLVHRFKEMSRQLRGSAFMTHSQMKKEGEKRLAMLVGLKSRVDAPRVGIRRIIHYIVKSAYFDNFILVNVLANAVVLGLNRFDHNESSEDALWAFNLYFLIAFTVEAILKIYSFGVGGYFASLWNKFDFVIVLIGWVDESFDGSAGISVLRLLRIARLFKVLRLQILDVLTLSLLRSLPAILNVGWLILIVIFSFNHALRIYFKDVPLTSSGLSDSANFSKYWTSLMTLFRVSTGDRWYRLFNSCLQGHSTLEKVPWYILFVGFLTWTSIILPKIIMAIVLDNFSSEKDDKEAVEFAKAFGDLADHWREFQSGVGQRISPHGLHALLRSMKRPLGFNGKLRRVQELRRLVDFNLLMHPLGQNGSGYYLEFVEVIHALAKSQLGIDVDVPEGGSRNIYMHEWFAGKIISDNLRDALRRRGEGGKTKW